MDFPPVVNKPADLAEVHLLTGINGTGKTRVLAALAALLGGGKALEKRLKVETKDRFFRITDRISDRRNPGVWPGIKANQHGCNPPLTSSVGMSIPAFAYHGNAYVTDASIGVLAATQKPDRATCLSFARPSEYSKVLLQGIANLKVQAAMDTINNPVGSTRSRAAGIIRMIYSSQLNFEKHIGEAKEMLRNMK